MGTAVTHDSNDGVIWRVATRTVHPRLSPFVHGLYGYVERSPVLLRRRELPAPQLVVIFQLGQPIRIFDSGQETTNSGSPVSFTAGIDDRFTVTEYRGEQSGVQLNLTPIGARLLFDLPMSKLAGRLVSTGDLLVRDRDFLARLADCTSWDARFDLVEALLARRLLVRPELRTQVVGWAYDRIIGSRGRADISDLIRETGYSHKHLLSLFRDQVGMTPKRLARLVRFDRLVDEVRSGKTDWSSLAVRMGYADQAHLVREVRAFSGLSPVSLSAMLTQPVQSESTR